MLPILLNAGSGPFADITKTRAHRVDTTNICIRHSTDTNNTVRFNYTMCFCELIKPLELFYLRKKVFSTRALIFDGEVGAIISKFMSGRQAPKPIKMRISPRTSSHTVHML
jgi:hypothetical protein